MADMLASRREGGVFDDTGAAGAAAGSGGAAQPPAAGAAAGGPAGAASDSPAAASSRSGRVDDTARVSVGDATSGGVVGASAAGDASASGEAGSGAAAGAGGGAGAGAAGDGTGEDRGDVLYQYVLMRGDLRADWPLGAYITQACHATAAALFQHRDDPLVRAFTADVDRMHQVTLVAKGETQLRNTAAKLTAAGFDHKLWIEQPEGYATCLATKPYPRKDIAKLFSKFKLLR